MPGRTFITPAYRYGFNGKENDNEVKGDGNQQDYGMRIYDPRVGKFLSVDPLTKSFPHYTPYQFSGNSPVANIDLDGEEEKYYKLTIDEKSGKANLQLVKSVDEKSFLGITWVPTLTYYVEYPQGPTGSKSYTFTRNGGPFSPENKIESFEHWVNQEHKNKNDRPEYLFSSDTDDKLRAFNAAAEVGMQNGVVGRYNAAGKTFTVVTATNNQTTAANGGNSGAANANAEEVTLKDVTPQQGPGFRSYNTKIADGKVSIMTAKGAVNTTGRYDFVITDEGKLVLGTGHYNLSEGSPTVQAAGEMKIVNGQVREITNSSGHYKPTVAQAEKAVTLIQNMGISTGGTRVSLYNADGSLNKTYIKQ